MATFTEQEIQEKLTGLDGWSADGSKITKTFEFDDFNAAMKFMVTAAPAIDALNHHPEWTNVYNTVEVHLSSHDVGGVTDRDFELAELLETFVEAAG